MNKVWFIVMIKHAYDASQLNSFTHLRALLVLRICGNLTTPDGQFNKLK